MLQATAKLKTVNVIPAIGEFHRSNPSLASIRPNLDAVSPPPPPGLNVHSMLKHEALVLTLETVRFLEEKLLWHEQRYTPLYPFNLPYADAP